jgi:alpha-L-rhamnosidase
MKKLMLVAAVVAAGMLQAANGGAALDKTTTFAAAESVWPAGLEKEMNTFVEFRAAFDVKAGDAPVLKMVAWYSYRVTLNGRFVGFGPARGPKGFFRADEWDLSKATRTGRNELLVEVAGYNVPNFYLMEQPPFFKAEVVCSGSVLAATKRADGAFAATKGPRIQKVPRYTYQRTFVESYRLPAAANPPALALAAAPEPTLIPRRAPYPDFEVNPRMTPVSFAKIRYDESVPLYLDRAMTYPETVSWFKGFLVPDMELNLNFLIQRLVSSDRRAATDAEKAAVTFALKAGESAVFDNGLNDTGFPGLRVEVREPGRLVLQFDEVLGPTGEARGIKRHKGSFNALSWDFEKPGVYDVAAFEPYTMRYVELDVVSGAMDVSAPSFRSYKNPTAKRAAFRASDPALVKIFDAAKESFRQNAVDVFMDCPGRERAGWNCDAFFTGPVSMLLTGDFALERVFEENLALPPKFDDIPDGAIPMCYPSDHRNKDFIPNWGMWFVLETEEYLQRTGDRATVDLLRPRLEKFVKFLWQYRNADGLLEKLPSWVFVEWSHSNKLVQDVNYPSNMTWADMLDAMNRMYGRADLADEARRVRETIRKQSWTGQWFCDNAVRQKDGSLKLSGECTETCQYYAFFHRVATPETHPALWKTLLTDFGPQRYDPADRTKLLKHPEIWPSNAFIGNYLRLKLLERAGLGRQILDETKGYFLYMADRTGTLWENDTPHASCNHGFASYVAVLLVHSVLGIEVNHLEKTVTVRPTDVDLGFCGVTLPVPGGELVYDWKVVNGKRETTFCAPPGWRLK